MVVASMCFDVLDGRDFAGRGVQETQIADDALVEAVLMYSSIEDIHFADTHLHQASAMASDSYSWSRLNGLHDIETWAVDKH